MSRILFAFFLLFSASAQCADYYWIGGAGNWTDTQHWADSSNGGVSLNLYSTPPGQYDDVYFDANSFTSPGQIVTADTTFIQCNNFSWTTVTNNPSFIASSNDSLLIYGSVELNASMTFTNSGFTYFRGSTTDTLVFNGHQFSGNVAFNGSGSWQMTEPLNVTGNIIHEQGTLHTDNYNISCNNISSNTSLIRSLKLGTSSITVSGSGNALLFKKTNLTLDADSSTITVSYSSSDSVNLSFGDASLEFNNIIISCPQVQFTSESMIDTLTLNSGVKCIFPAGKNQYTNAFIITGTCSSPILLESDVAGFACKLNQTSGTVSGTYLYLKDITALGGATFNATQSINEGNVTGWAITEPTSNANINWIGNTGNWHDASNWSTGCIPGPSDNVFFNAGSFSGNDTVYIDENAYCANMDWSTATNNPILDGRSNKQIQIRGSVVLKSTLNAHFTGTYNFKSTSPQTLSSDNCTLNGPITFNDTSSANTGGWTLQDNLTSSQGINLFDGTLTTNNNNLTCLNLLSSDTNKKEFNLGNSTLTLTGNESVYDLDTNNLTFTTGNSNIYLTYQGVEPAIFNGYGNTYHNLYLNSTAAEVYGSNSFHILSVIPGGNATFNSTDTTTIDSLKLDGTCNEPISLSASEINGAPTVFKKVGFDTVNTSYLCLSNVTADTALSQIYNATNTTEFYDSTGWTITSVGLGVNYYWIGGSGNWSDNSHWSLSSGGGSTACLPNINDSIYFDANSGFTANDTVLLDVNGFCSYMDWSAATGSPTFTLNRLLNSKGDIIFNSGMAITRNTLSARIRIVPNTNNVSLNATTSNLDTDISFEAENENDTLFLLSNLMMADSNLFTFIKGTFVTNNFNINTGAFNSAIQLTKTLELGSSTLDLYFGWGIGQGGAELTFDAGTSTINIHGSQSIDYFYGEGATYSSVSIDNKNDTLTKLTGSNTFTNLTIQPGVKLEVEQATIQAISGVLSIKGNCTDSIELFSDNSGTDFSLNHTSVTNDTLECVKIKDVNGSVSSSTFFTLFSTDLGNNTSFTELNNPPSVADFTTTYNLCLGDIATFTNTSTAFSGNPADLTYEWDLGNGETATSTDTTMEYLYGGTYIVVLKAIYSNNCFSVDTDSVRITAPTVTMYTTESDTTICSGDTVTFSLTNNADQYQFFVNSTATGPASTDTFYTTNTLAHLDTVYGVGTLNGCPKNSTSFVHIVNPLPTISFVSTHPSGVACDGDTVTFSASGGDIYEYYVNGTLNGFATTDSNFSISTLTTGDIVTVIGKLSSTECSDTSLTSFTMTINPKPSPTMTCSDPDYIICEGDMVTFTAAGATTYEFFLGGISLGPSSPTSSVQIDTLTNLETVTVVGTSNGCAVVSPDSYSLTVNALPVVPFSSSDPNDTICVGDLVNFTASGAAIYEFFVNGVSQGSPSGAATFSTSTLSNGDSVAVIGTSNGCSNPGTSSYTFTVIPMPTISLVSSDANDTICLNESVTFTASGGSEYQFFIASTSQTTLGPTSTFTITSIMDGQTVTVMGYVNGCGQLASSSFTYKVHPLPNINFYSSDLDNTITECETITFTATGGISYEYFIDGISQGAPSSQNTFTTNSLTNGQTVSVQGTSNNGCPNTGNSSFQITVNAPPSVQLSSSAPGDTICQGQSVTFSSSGASNYEFFLNGASIGPASATNYYTTNTLLHGDVITVIGSTFGCPNNGVTTHTMTVFPYPTVSLVSSDPNDTICYGDTVIFTANGATQYEFFINGVSQAPPSTNNTFTTSSLTSGKVVSVVGSTFGCSSTSSSTFTLKVWPLPSVNFYSSDPDNEICYGESVTYTALGADNYEFFVDGVSQGAPSTSTTLTTSTLPVDSPLVQVQGTTNGCSAFSTTSFPMTVNPIPSVTLTDSDSDDIICQGDSVSFIATGAALYEYQINGLSQGPASSDSTFISGSLSNGETVSVVGTTAGCSSTGTPTITYTVNPLPSVTLSCSDIDQIICTGDTISFTSTGAAQYQFYIDTSPLGSLSSNDSIALSNLINGQTISVVGTTNGCSSNGYNSYLMAVNPLPTISTTCSDPDTSICSGDQITFTSTGTNLYEFFVDGISTGAPAILNTYSTDSISNGQTITFAGLSMAGCYQHGTDTFVFNINPYPNITFTTSDTNSAICAGETVVFSGFGAQQYDFQVNGTPSGMNPADSVYSTDSLTNGQSITLTGTADGCSITADTSYTFSVYNYPAVSITSSDNDNQTCETDTIVIQGFGASLYEFFIDGISQGAPSTQDSFVVNNITTGQVISANGITNGCSSSADTSFQFTVSSYPNVAFTSSDIDNEICYGDSIVFTASGANNYEFFIDNNSMAGPSSNNQFIPLDLETGETVSVIGYNQSCGSDGDTSFQATVHKLDLDFSNTSSGNLLCEGGSVTFTATGADAYEFFIDGVSQGASSATNTFITTNLTNDQTVSLQASSNTTGCTQTATDFFQFAILPTPTITANGPVQFCEGDSVLLSSNYQYGNQWTKNSIPINGENTNQLNVNTSGSYGLSVTSGGNGNIWSVGKNQFGQLGNSSMLDDSIASPADTISGFVEADAGVAFNIALKSDGSIWLWGGNTFGTIGDGTFTNRDAPKKLIGISDGIQICAGYQHALALKSDSTVFAWGNNTDGQLGIGNNSLSYLPIQIPGLTSIKEIAAGEFHSIALDGNGNIWTWGSNSYGQLGNNSLISSNVPVLVAGVDSVVAIGSGANHNFAILSDGSLWTWGNNANGQLGIGGTLFSSVPLKVPGIKNIIAAKGGSMHSICIDNKGRAYSWGNNTYGQLGNGTLIDSEAPQLINGINNAKSVEAGYYNSYVQRNDKRIFCWGENTNGELGTGNTSQLTSPVEIDDIYGISSIAAGENHLVLVAEFSSTCTSNDTIVTVDSITTAIIYDNGISLSTVSGASYQWYVDGILLPSETNQEITPLIQGDYTVMVTFANGCTSLSSSQFFSLVGTSDIVQTSLSIYPNPTSGFVQVDFGNRKIIDGRIEIYDITSRKMTIITVNKYQSTYQIDLSEYPTGVYFLTHKEKGIIKETSRIVVTQ